MCAGFARGGGDEGGFNLAEKEANGVILAGDESSPVLSGREKREVAAGCGHGEEWMRTQGLGHFTATSSSQAAAWRGAWQRGTQHAHQRPAAVHPPLWSTVAGFIPSFSFF